MQQKIKRLQAQLRDLKGKSKDTSCVSDTLNPLSQKLENVNVELEFQVSVQKDNICGTSTNTKFAKQSILGKPPMLGETHALSKPFTSNSIPTPQESKVMKNDKVIAPGMFRINPFKTSREEKHVPNNVTAIVRTKPINVSQPPVFTKKDVNSDTNGLSSTGIDNTKTRRPQPRRNTKNDRVPSASMSSCNNNKGIEVEEHHRNLLLSNVISITIACFTQNRSIIHLRFNKTPYELINGRKLDITFLYVFGALCYPKNNREDIGKLGAKGDTGFFIGYSADSCAYKVYNRRKNKIIETRNVSFYELLAMAFEQRSSKLGLQSMTSRQISLGLDFTYAPTTITSQQPSEDELDLLFEAMYDDFIGGEPSRPVLTRNQLRSDGDICMYALTSNYVLEILKKYGMESCDPIGTPMEIKDKHDLDQNGTPVDATKYRSMIGALMYLTSSRLDIVHATCLYARYQDKPTEKHLKKVKRIFRYLRGTVNMGLWYTKVSDFELTRFSDADYARCKDTFKSTSGEAQFFGEKLTDYQLADIFAKALPTDRFNYLVGRLGSINGVTTSFQRSQDLRPHAQSTKIYSR
nr:uncharacterized mitochondrial protein AtMg00810-like [Tanacetum cinerariifolium]